jgi:thiol-disulfide isomerase/thioredoxin
MRSLVALVAIGLLLPGVLAQDAEIKNISQVDISKGVVVLDFMATWCGPCRSQMGELKKVKAQYGDKVRIISVDMDGRETKDMLANYKKEVGADWEFVIDDNGTYNTYKGRFLSGIPTLAILKDGEKVYSHVGVTSSTDLAREIEKVL